MMKSLCACVRPTRLLLIWLAGCVAVTAQANIQLTAQEVESWADATFNHAFEEQRFSGLVIAVVQGGEILFTQGYGYADFNARTPVNPTTTKFRIGSNTKTFTATAIVQLLDRGLIASLDDPVNKYLKRVRLPDVFGEITLWHLLTHRAGFEDRAWRLGNADPDVTIPATGEQIKARMQAVVRPPGQRSVYCNFCTALLGAVIEDVTGQTYKAYLQDNILTPLGMASTELVYDVTSPDNEGVPYAFFPSGEAQRVPYLSVDPFIAPAGALSATATDITKFMIAHLDAGRTDPNPILSPEHFDLMHTQHTTNHPATSGFGAKFIIGKWNGERTFEHGGGWPGFESIMTMLPDSNVGFFIAVMSSYPNTGLGETLFGSERQTTDDGANQGRPLNLFDLRQLFMYRFLGPFVPEGGGVPTVEDDLSRYVGVYWHQRRAHTNFEAFLDLLDPLFSTRDVVLDTSGGLSINGRDGYLPVSAGVFFKEMDHYDVDDEPWLTDVYGFTDDSSNQPVFLDTFGPDAFMRASRWWNPLALQPFMLLGIIGCLLGIFAVAWPAATGGATLARYIVLSLGIFPISTAYVLLGGFDDGDAIVFDLLGGKADRFVAFSTLTTYVTFAAVLLGGLAIQAWRHRYWGDSWRALFSRIHCSLAAVSALLLLPVFAFAHLIGWQMP